MRSLVLSFRLTAWAAVSLSLAFCSSSKDSGTGPNPVTAPANLSYAVSAAVYPAAAAIPNDAPSSSGGAVTSYSVSPALPAGLALDPTSGVISGTPTAATSFAVYTITATNSAGNTTTTVKLTIVSARHSVTSFSVGADVAVSYPNLAADPNHLTDFADEHTTFVLQNSGNYLVWGASKIASAPANGAVVLTTSDLQSFDFATALGYNRQVLTSPVAFDQCDPAFASEFDENYAAPGSVVQDQTLAGTNLIMVYEAENHCPGGVNQQPYYATIGLARSADGGKTWSAPVNSSLGSGSRYVILKGYNPQPNTPYTAMGDAVPSAHLVRDAQGDYYLYVAYGYHDGGLQPAADNQLRIARAKLGPDPLTFQKWYNGSFSQPGIGGLDSGVLPGSGCSPNSLHRMADLSFNDDLGMFLLVFLCTSGPSGARVAGWYYSTATSMDLENWTTPQLIAGSQQAVTVPCPGKAAGELFDGFYPSLVSPGASPGRTKLTGKVFFVTGCDTGARTFMSRTFTIAATP